LVAAAPVEVVRPLHHRSARARHRGESSGDSGPDESELERGGERDRDERGWKAARLREVRVGRRRA
jgi:hypothetical protein